MLADSFVFLAYLCGSYDKSKIYHRFGMLILLRRAGKKLSRCSFQNKKIARKAKDESPIKFPGPVHYAFDDKVHASCKDLTFCTIKPADYPEEKFNKMFKDYKSLPQPTLIEDLKPEDNRQGNPDDENNCQSIVTYEPLYTVRQKRDEPWRTVVQAPGQDFVQRVRLERCSEPDGKCFEQIPQSPDFETFCKQKVVTWEILVAKGDNGTEKIPAELPICCSCHYRAVAFAKFGIPENNIKN